MDAEVSYPSAKRRRTSRSQSTSRSASRTPVRSRQDSPTARQSRNRSQARSSRATSRSRSRSPHRRRRRGSSSNSPTDHSSHYETPQGSRSRDGSRYSRTRPSVSPISRDPDLLPLPTTSSTKGTTKTTSHKLRFLPLATLPRAHARGITCAKFSPDGALLATASADATINIYSVPRYATIKSKLGVKQEEQESSASSIAEFKHIRTLRGHLSGVNALSWSPISNPTNTTTTSSLYTLASASDDKDIMLWSPLSSDAPIAPSPLSGHSNYVYSLAFSPKGNMLVSGSYDEAVFLWDVRSGRCMRKHPAHSDPVRGVDFVCDGTMMCSCSTDGLIRIWDSGTGQCLRTLVDEDRKGVTSVMFAPNGKYLLAWTLDGCVRLWDYVSGRCVKTYQGHVNKEFTLAGCIGTYIPQFNGGSGGGEDEQGQDGAFVASGSEDGDIMLWDVTTKEILWRGVGHKDVVLSVDSVRPLDFNPDHDPNRTDSEGEVGYAGRSLLASVGRDRDVRIWIEDVTDLVLRKRREKGERLHQQQEEQRGAGVGRYAVDDDDDDDDMMVGGSNGEVEGLNGDQNEEEEEEAGGVDINMRMSEGTRSHINGNDATKDERNGHVNHDMDLDG